MNDSVVNIQKQIKAFNKYMSRNLDNISDEVYEAIEDLIDLDRLTASGFARAGSKYLENMSHKDLLAYSSDIEEARMLLDFDMITDQLDINNAKDPKSALWRMADKLKDAGMPFDSDQVKLVADEKSTNVKFKDMMLQMNKLLHNPDYGLSDFYEWWDRKEGLQE